MLSAAGAAVQARRYSDDSAVPQVGRAVAGDGSGAVYAFERVNGSWTEQAKLIANNAGNFDNFGRSIAMNAGTADTGTAESVRRGAGRRRARLA